MQGIYRLGGANPKHHTEAVWDDPNGDYATFIPIQGELIIYDSDSNYQFPRFKVGDGVAIVAQLPFSKTDELVAGVIRIDFTVTPQQWIEVDLDEYTFNIYNTNITQFMEVIEFNLTNPEDQLEPINFEVLNDGVKLTTSKKPSETWFGHLVLGQTMNANIKKIDYPKIALIRIQINVEPEAWILNSANNTRYFYATNQNIRREMSVVGWEPEIGYDFPYTVSYETATGYVKINSSVIVTTPVRGWLTFGADSATIDVNNIVGAAPVTNYVVSVNGQSGIVNLNLNENSVGHIALEIEPDYSLWERSAWEQKAIYAGEDSNSTAYTYEYSYQNAAVGDWFDCQFAYGFTSPIYFTIYDGRIVIQTKTIPQDTTYIEGALIKGSENE